MNISAINQTYNMKSNQTQAFKGLWRQTTASNDRDKAMCIFKNKETTYYHPFSDETKEEIDKVVKKNSCAYMDESIPQYIIKECRVCTTLPFSKKQFNEYYSANSDIEVTPTIRRIHAFVSDKFINSNLDAQKSAINSNVSKAIDFNG